MAGTFGGNIPGGTNKKSSERAREIMGVEERYGVRDAASCVLNERDGRFFVCKK